MEARLISAALAVASVLSLGASYRTQNFLITAHTPQFAKQLGDAAEIYRRDLAIDWLGRELPPWQQPCPITVHAGPHLGAGGATSFMFDNGRPFGWTMTIQGSEQRLLDSVLPHEITHTIMATHFGRPLPRWADEGAATSVEHSSEKNKQAQMLVRFLTTGRGIAFNKMFAMREYPSDIMPLYSQGYSLARFLIAQKGKQQFVAYVGDGMDWNNWTAATKKHYGYESLSQLQVSWLDWVRRGCPPIEPKTDMIAMQDGAGPRRNTGAAPADSRAQEGGQASGTPATLASGSAAPPTRLASANSSSFDSWYARQREKPSETGPSREQEQPGAPRRGAPSSRLTNPPARQPMSVTRPQEPVTPQPRVIQWTQDQPPVYGIPGNSAPSPMAPVPSCAPYSGSL